MYENLSLEEVQVFLNDEKTSKAILQQIAQERFGRSAGQTKTSRSKLCDLIETDIMNEETHNVIARLASAKK